MTENQVIHDMRSISEFEQEHATEVLFNKVGPPLNDMAGGMGDHSESFSSGSSCIAIMSL